VTTDPLDDRLRLIRVTSHLGASVCRLHPATIFTDPVKLFATLSHLCP
jgi:hypothetical protein